MRTRSNPFEKRLASLFQAVSPSPQKSPISFAWFARCSQTLWSLSSLVLKFSRSVSSGLLHFPKYTSAPCSRILSSLSSGLLLGSSRFLIVFERVAFNLSNLFRRVCSLFSGSLFSLWWFAPGSQIFESLSGAWLTVLNFSSFSRAACSWVLKSLVSFERFAPRSQAFYCFGASGMLLVFSNVLFVFRSDLLLLATKS